ncbi:sigma-70 family RNA polymerase sigma factor [Arthrobacter caoxuetaonis]|uniref:RNA polymerase sigma factor n=1 Tax=Arthrobacter caoxuetaonis TaxID=2886935 RepID=A0A9X1SC80_9MICC|nr:sigma-70 family RNA polymerase sigma factor [Arthrobacter caoxuetaonis]MCC3297883.1 RNA polymerase sigma factor [Arthrobacter caoxuetaonis]USQ55931.1 RNA polymerase sigma factor [Arthrobacter caoxuetaonis]
MTLETGTAFEAGTAGETAALAENRANLRQARRDFLVALEPVRASVYAYCRSLTPTVWDAEDLLQETLTKALAEASQRYEPIRNTQAWLIRIATNTWIDSLRRSSRAALEWTDSAPDFPDDAAPDPLANLAVESALRQLLHLLPPRERACVVLKDVFSYPLAEIAEMLETTPGAVKSALHRGRATLQAARTATDPAGPFPKAVSAGSRDTVQPAGHEALLRRLAAAFNAYDIDAMVSLFLTSGRSEVVGNATETGHEEIRTGSLTDTFGPDAAEIHRSTVHRFDGEDVILMWERQKGAPGASEVVSDVLRVRPAFGAPLIAELKWYFFCPEVLAEVAGGLGLPFKTNGVSYF